MIDLGYRFRVWLFQYVLYSLFHGFINGIIYSSTVNFDQRFELRY